MNIIHDVHPLPGDAYGQVLDRYLAAVTPAPGVRTVLQFGEISTPGVSDLDLLVVVDDDAPVSTLQQIREAARADSMTVYMFAHPPMVVPRSCARKAVYIHSLYHLRPVWGEGIELEALAVDDQRCLRIAEYTDFTFNIRSVLRAGHADTVGLRRILLLLASCLHSLRLAATIARFSLEGDLPDRIMQLREFSLRNRAQPGRSARSLMEQCVAELRQADSRMEAHLHSQGVLRPSPLRTVLPHTDGKFYSFETPFQPMSPLAPRAKRSSAVLGRLAHLDMSVESFPGFYLSQFAAYGMGSGLYASAHEAFFGRAAAKRILDPGYREVLIKRCQIVQRIYDVVSRGGLLPMVPLGIGFRDPRRIRPSRRRQWLRRLAVPSRASLGA
jgi:hypothetical protein